MKKYLASISIHIIVLLILIVVYLVIECQTRGSLIENQQILIENYQHLAGDVFNCKNDFWYDVVTETDYYWTIDSICSEQGLPIYK